MFYNADSGLYLTQYRGYDPVAGRWLSRDPVGEGTDPAGNLYAYVGGNPIGLVDPFGLQDIPSAPPPEIPGGPWTPAGSGQKPGTWFGPKPAEGGPRPVCRWVPPAGEGGPPGSSGYFKTQVGGSGNWSRYDPSGKSISPEQAHPNPLPSNPIPPVVRYTSPAGVFLGIVLHSRPAY
jgi:RHS repeat-associated protein